MTDTDLLTPREYASYRRCSVRTLDRERADGLGCPYIRIGARILYRRADVDHWLDAHRVGGDHRRGPVR
jgi:Helix-turn-helix domain